MPVKTSRPRQKEVGKRNLLALIVKYVWDKNKNSQELTKI